MRKTRHNRRDQSRNMYFGSQAFKSVFRAGRRRLLLVGS